MTKDYSRKPYQTKASYPEMIRQTPARAFWNSITEQQPVFSEYGAKGKKLTATERRYLQFLKQSEAKKPYLADDYQSMEYEWEGLPGLQDGNPHIDHPWMPDPQPTRIDKILPPEPGTWILYAFTEDKWCPDKTRTITINGTHPIYDVRFTFPIALQPGTSFVITGGLGTPTVTIDLTADALETGIISMQAYEEAFDAPPLPSTQGRGWTGFPVYEDEEYCDAFFFNLSMANGDLAKSGVAFYIKDSTGSNVSFNRVFDSGLDRWVITINDPLDPLGYWVEYNKLVGQLGSVRTQYPFLYKTADKYKNPDLISPGDYTDEIHYFYAEDRVIEPFDPTVTSSNPPCSATAVPIATPDFIHLHPASTVGRVAARLVNNGSQLIYSRTIKSSVEYRFFWTWNNNFVNFGHADYNPPIPPGTQAGNCIVVNWSPGCNDTENPFQVTYSDSDGQFNQTYLSDLPKINGKQLGQVTVGSTTFPYIETSPDINGKKHSFIVDVTEPESRASVLGDGVSGGFPVCRAQYYNYFVVINPTGSSDYDAPKMAAAQVWYS